MMGVILQGSLIVPANSRFLTGKERRFEMRAERGFGMTRGFVVRYGGLNYGLRELGG
jgi:hypothetical protein